MTSRPEPVEVARRVAEALRGSQPAFAWLYRRFAPLVHAVHLGRAPAALADELTQESFSLAFARLGQLRDAQHFGAWIAAIARRQRRPAALSVDALDELREPAAGDAAPEDAAEAARMLGAIRALPEAYREPLMLRLVEGMSGPEIAALTGLTPASVRVNLYRGMARLRAALDLAPQSSEERHDRLE